MSIPKSKMLSVSKSILAHASAKRDTSHLSNQQSQVVNVNVNPTPTVQNQVQNPTPTPTVNATQPQQNVREVDENVYVIDPIPAYPETNATDSKSMMAPPPQTGFQPSGPSPLRSVDTAYAELGEMRSLLNNSETVTEALILIIDLIQSNPLMINKFIVPIESTFKELIAILTGASDVDIKYNDDIGCQLSKKYNLIEDVYVVKNGETLNVRYSFPEVLRLFDRFHISTKMIAVEK